MTELGKIIEDDFNGMPATGATFGPAGNRDPYRYRLWRRVGPGVRRVGFVMLNPSTANETDNDPTIRRCINYAKAWGFGLLEVGNIFALRSTDPKGLLKVSDPIGPDNDRHLLEMAKGCEFVVAAWGAHQEHRTHGRFVRFVLTQNGVDLRVLRLTKNGDPGHPLYLPGNLVPVPWGAA